MQYFGLEGREAVKEAFTAVNDFFENDEYSGVSELELTAHGFRSNYNTAWMNTTAKNAQVIDIKSLAMGLIVNQLDWVIHTGMLLEFIPHRPILRELKLILMSDKGIMTLLLISPPH